ncbi:MarR family winged helix-turn-helix transcriptional regulator [Sphaerimonospora thailandensis]|uniref:Transcriptional regulator n=1 Tax=Sphaerimonospora thailandensis TaxID=795644 RepID=A0A8J3VWY0_9ACTN|nr:MarR family transcriptional regulator [Sphaerimonospora thailandensis]GIH68329.1 transcriptional regulator [Sphaerimonospora thailandensis]
MEDPRWLSAQEQRAWRAHLAAHRLLFHQLDRELHEEGLSLNDYEILVNLSESPDHRMRMSELADATIQSRSRLSHQISRMEAAGLVVRASCDDDRRGTFAVLTDLGWKTIQRAAPGHVAGVRRHLIDLLTPEQVTAIEEIFGPIADRLQSIRTAR